MASSQRPWLFVLGAVFSLLMVYAMMECVVAFLARPTPRRRSAASRAELLSRLAALNDRHGPYTLVPSDRADLEVRIDPIDPAWAARFARVKRTISYRARLLLDEERLEVRCFELVYSPLGFIGFDGFRPRVRWQGWFAAGLIDVCLNAWAYGILPGFPPRIGGVVRFRVDTVALKRDIRAIAARSGWSFRPKVWWFQVRRRRDGSIARGLIPSATRYWTERQFWGVMYPLLYLLAIGSMVVGGSGWSGFVRRDTLLPVAAFSALWWGISGAIIVVFRILGRGPASRPESTRGHGRRSQ